MASIWLSWATLVEIIGVESATALCLKYGGVEVYVPSNPEAGELAGIIGAQAMQALSAYAGGSAVMLPNAARQKPKKSRIIRLLQAGWTPRRIAIECGVTERWVRHLAERSCMQVQRRLPLSVK